MGDVTWMIIRYMEGTSGFCDDDDNDHHYEDAHDVDDIDDVLYDDVDAIDYVVDDDDGVDGDCVYDNSEDYDR